MAFQDETDGRAEFQRAVSEFMLHRLQAGCRALEQALALGAAHQQEIMIREGANSMRLMAIVPTHLGEVESLLVSECKRVGLNAYVEVRNGRIYWDCDPVESPWGRGRQWHPTDLVEEIALATAFAGA